MSKYIVLGIVIIFWIILPPIAKIAGLSYTYVEVESLRNTDAFGGITDFVIGIANYFSFYIRALTFSIPNAPVLISWFVWCMIPLTGLAIVSVFRGD